MYQGACTRTQEDFLSPDYTDMVRACHYALKSLQLSAQYSERRYSPPRLYIYIYIYIYIHIYICIYIV